MNLRITKIIGKVISILICLVMIVQALTTFVLNVSATNTKDTNVALRKKVTAAGINATTITDGNTSNNYWDGGVGPSEFLIDLGSGYLVSSMKAFTYYGDGRYYHYDIYVSLDGFTYEKVASKNNNQISKASGDVYTFNKPLNLRYVRVNVTFNSANPSVHMNEFMIFGRKDDNYVEPEKPKEDPNDPNNIAFLKPTRSNLGVRSITQNVNDGLDFTYYSAMYYPSTLDIDLLEKYDLKDMNIMFDTSKGNYYYYTVYGSNDYKNFDRIYVHHDKSHATSAGDKIDLSGKSYRFLRISLEYDSKTNGGKIGEIRVHGTPTGKFSDEIRTGSIEEILNVKSFDNSKYSSEIPVKETIENIYGIIERTVGAQYKDWFSFEIKTNSKNENDYYEISLQNGKVHIVGNDGVSLASGLNYYYKNYCNVNISELASQTVMPKKIVKIDGTIRKETEFKIRYAFNYCTLSYTFPFYGTEEFQKEYDFLALNGVNVVLDLAGQEAVWIKFLMNFGYSFDEAKNWIAGPCYYAWQFMDNLDVIGGPISDDFVSTRLEMARETQRWKRSLGMQTVLQGYAGMVPNDFSYYKPNVQLLEQGSWCGFERPDMIRTDSATYDEYADLFYNAQKWAFGDTSDYYAVDPFHEGGIRPKDLSDEVIAKEILDSLLKHDKNAVWMVQAWFANPTNELLHGMGDLKNDHVVILDLQGLEDPRWSRKTYSGGGNTTKLDGKQFNGTNFVWCILTNYGGNPSMNGHLDLMIKRVNMARNAKYMRGIGIISESAFDNPIVYELLLDMVWEDGNIDLNQWIKSYITRRYGAESESAYEAWMLMKNSNYSHIGNSSYMMMWKAPENYTSAPGIGYDVQKLEAALRLFVKDFDKLSNSEAYLFDVSEIMRQVVTNYAQTIYADLYNAYSNKNLAEFKKYKEKYLNAFDILNMVQLTRQDQLVGEWIGKAYDMSNDDFTYDYFAMNAKMLIATWGNANTGLEDYAYRNYEGMIIDVYKARWQVWLDKLETELEKGTIAKKLSFYDYFKIKWDWVINTPEYTRTAKDSPEFIYNVAARVFNECMISTDAVVYKNIAENRPVKETGHVPEYGHPDYPGGFIPNDGKSACDGDYSTYWDGGNWAKKPYIIIDLEDIYKIEKINVINYAEASGRYYHYEIYSSLDGKNFELMFKKDDNSIATSAGNDFIIKGGKEMRYIKVVGIYQNHNEGFHVREVSAYESPEHSLGEWVEIVEPTCEHDGIKGHYKCEDCGKYFDLFGNEIKDIVIKATGHKFGDGVVIKEPTTTEEGKIKYVCEHCGKEKIEIIEKLPEEATESENINDSDQNDVANQKDNKVLVIISVSLTVLLVGAIVFIVMKKAKK